MKGTESRDWPPTRRSIGISAVLPTIMLTTRAIRAFSSAAKRRPIVGGNWKCNPEDPAKLEELVANINACDTSKCDVYVCPSNLHVGIVYKSFTNGAITCSP